MEERILITIRSNYIQDSGVPWDSYAKIIYGEEELEKSLKKFAEKVEKIIARKQKLIDLEYEKNDNIDSDFINKLYRDQEQLENSELLHFRVPENSTMDGLLYELSVYGRI